MAVRVSVVLCAADELPGAGIKVERAGGANAHSRLAGSEPQVKLTVWEYPPTGVTVIAVVAVWPATTVRFAELAETLKSCATTRIGDALDVDALNKRSPE